MGSILYDFLSESLLFDETRIANRFAGLSDSELRDELDRYRNYCVGHLQELRREIPTNRPNSFLFSGTGGLSLDQLKRTALYTEGHVLADPLFAHTYAPNRAARTMVALVQAKPESLDREELCGALDYLKAVTPMVAVDYVKFLPLGLIYEPPRDVFIRYSPTYFSDNLPKPILEFFHNKAKVRTTIQTDDGRWIILSDCKLSRGIAITFEGQSDNGAFIYHLKAMQRADGEGTGGTLKVAISQPNTPPTKEMFDAWVFQSINLAAGDVHNRVLAEFAASAECNAMFLAPSPLAFEFLSRMGAQPANIAGHTTTSLLDLDLPVLDGIDIADVLRVRTQEGEAFQNFRDALERGFRELRAEDDPEKLSVKTNSLVHELTEVKLREIGPQIESLRRTAFAGSVLAALGLVGAVSTGGASLLATAIAGFQCFKTYEEYRRQVKTNPAFLLWKLKH